MSFPRRLAIFMIVSTLALWVGVVYIGGGFSGWKFRGWAQSNYELIEKKPDGSMQIPNGNQTITVGPPRSQGVTISQPGHKDITVLQAEPSGELPEQNYVQSEHLPSSNFRPVTKRPCGGDKPCGDSYGDNGFRPVRPKND